MLGFNYLQFVEDTFVFRGLRKSVHGKLKWFLLLIFRVPALVVCVSQYRTTSRNHHE